MISVIIPVYNRPKLVKRAIESVKKQSIDDKEIIVVDDGSTDDTVNVLKSIDGIKIITKKNGGVSSARNRGIKEANGEWIAFLDSDDEFKDEKLKIQLEFHKQNPNIRFSHTLEEWIRDGNVIRQKACHKKPEGFSFEQNLNFCKIGPSTVMIDKKVFKEVGYFDESLEVCEDYDMWLRVLKEHKVGLIDKILTIKYAGHKQLSFKYHSMDRYRVKALLKHKELEIVKKEINKKIDILLKGAIKHQNSEIKKFCLEILKMIEHKNMFSTFKY